MITGLKETDDNWAWLSTKHVEDTVVYENGDKEPLCSAHYVLDFGKYKGTRLSDLDDEWYLNFLRKTATQDGDQLLIKMLDLCTE
jgi:uncharacterized protein (DUF3820 family)